MHTNTTVESSKPSKGRIPLPLNIGALYPDIQKLSRSFYKSSEGQAILRKAARDGHAGRRIEAEDFAQDVALLIVRRQKEGGASSYDPSRGTFGTWVYQCCRNVLGHATDRHDTEAPFADADTLSRATDMSPGLVAAAERAMLELERPALKRLAKCVLADRKRGQMRLFPHHIENPNLAFALER